ncbi:hypothetical protein BCR41DRAFT_113367 [Lobosporangium transversale]|uniref:Uncharacterized protein n=1 Tax=Lobosporangium transversale TaxID=64571 RepID=A0A1Y2GIP6_9FUNG|nr:hypothetical protein BCR41DRAFT_113367 [Lobosporangium transversale]ORZ10901.1 hypothetical protein BCR41DRAFT_113367 [Lobosporangium transversale]|eukprot:XP_021879418.1 hypothetical protein BCR41DRAFT_113367 [Lobosporangium transversale]
MRLELNRSWQQQPNAFRMNTLKAIRSLTTANAASSTDCCICLFRIASFQSLFVAPFLCVSLQMHPTSFNGQHPGFYVHSAGHLLILMTVSKSMNQLRRKYLPKVIVQKS